MQNLIGRIAECNYNGIMELSDDALVLVAIMPKPRDMDIARLLGWYRIPLKSAPKILHPDVIAFYQTSSFPKGHRSQIEYYSEVAGVELTTRAELFRDEPDHPRAHEEYFKIQLRSMERLPNPVLADEWKRFTFFYTTGSRLYTAETIRGLAMNARERVALRSGRGRRRRRQWHPTPVLLPGKSHGWRSLVGCSPWGR